MNKEAGVNIKKLSVGRKDLFLLKPEDIFVDRSWNERNLERPNVKEHIAGLALSISKIGVQQPLTVARRGDKVLLTDGYCRMAAVKIAIEKHGADIKGVPVRVEEKGSNDADHVLSMLTRNDGLALTFAEQTRIVKRLIAFGWDKKEIAEKTGRSLTHIDNCVMLLEADQKIMQHLDDGKVSARFTLDILRRYSGTKATPEVIISVIENEISKAAAAGKSKATQRTASTGTKKIIWGKYGPEFMKLLDELVMAYDKLETVPDSIGDIVNYYKEFKEENKLQLDPDNYTTGSLGQTIPKV